MLGAFSSSCACAVRNTLFKGAELDKHMLRMQMSARDYGGAESSEVCVQSGAQAIYAPRRAPMREPQ